MNPETAKTAADFLLADLEYEIQTTARILAAVPGTQLDYRPDPLSKTALALVRHIVLEDEFLLNCIADGAFPSFPDDTDACGIMSPADGVARYQEKMPAAIARVRALSGQQLSAILDLMGMIQMPAVNFLSLALKHSVHHRGQLSTYLRPMGGKVPGIYGPSADTQADAATA
ncbi:MAG: DinB family protein [Candidatus Solibacter sp.]